MRLYLASLTAVLLLVAVVFAQNPAKPAANRQYKIDIDKVFSAAREKDGKKAIYVTVQFKVKYASDGKLAGNIGKNEILVEEDHQRVTDLEIFQPQGNDQLTAVLAMDTSGSMVDNGKMAQAKHAAEIFLDKLSEHADSGLILFNHELLQPTLPPIREPERFAEHRNQVRARVRAAQPSGGTAYFDAAAAAIDMLRGREGRRAVLLMTDGVDLNSKRGLQEVVDMAKTAEVPVYTIGVGEPGKNEPVSTVLVLDRSGSMRAPADETDRMSKIEALHTAAWRFIDIMRPGAKTKVLPFSTQVDKAYLPAPFSDSKDELRGSIAKLRPSGGTALYDATYDAVETLEAARPVGKRAVVVLTDGVDESPGSRHRVDEVIQRARETQTPLHMLGFGRENEIDAPVMKRMADETGGKFYHAQNQKKLLEIFENLSIQLHDEGIDEASLRQLAEQTGGKYFPARDVSQLQLIYEGLAQELQSTYTVTFPSRRSSHDGTARGIDISVERDGKRLSDVARADYNVHGVVVPEMNPSVYLVLLALLGGLLAVPAGVRRLYRFYGGT
jgi:VWFA-related protein